jgi:hypothetical protein
MKNKWAPEENAVTKAYKKKIRKAMDMVEKLHRIMSEIPIDYEPGKKKQPPEYNVRLDGATSTIISCLDAIENALSEINHDLIHGNYVEGEG